MIVNLYDMTGASIKIFTNKQSFQQSSPTHQAQLKTYNVTFFNFTPLVDKNIGRKQQEEDHVTSITESLFYLSDHALRRGKNVIYVENESLNSW